MLQEAALAGLWRSKFFDKAAFYGGTALRLFHGLDRFSEDLDFTLLDPDPSWNLSDRLQSLRTEIEAPSGRTEVRPLLEPFPVSVRVVVPECMGAGKDLFLHVAERLSFR